MMGNTSHINPRLIGNQTIIENGFIGLQFIFGLAIVITNSLFIVTFFRSEKIRTMSNGILVKMSACDCLVGWMLVILPLKIVFDKNNNAFCYAFDIILGTFVFGSNMSILEITCERFARIAHPFSSERWITKNTFLIIFLFEQCFMISNIIIIILMSSNDEKSGAQCSICEYTGMNKNIQIIGFFFCSLALSVSTFMYIHLARIARRHRRIVDVQIQANNENSSATRSSTTQNSTVMDRKRINMIGLILAVQYISLIPLMTLVVFKLVHNSPELDQSIEHSLIRLCDLALYSTSLWNAIIYPWRCPEIKREIKRTWLYIKTVTC